MRWSNRGEYRSVVKEEVKKGNYSTNKVPGFYILFDNFFEVYDEIPNSNTTSSALTNWTQGRLLCNRMATRADCSPSLKFGAYTSFKMESRNGAVMRALASHKCGPSSILVSDVICGLPCETKLSLFTHATSKVTLLIACVKRTRAEKICYARGGNGPLINQSERAYYRSHIIMLHKSARKSLFASTYFVSQAYTFSHVKHTQL